MRKQKKGINLRKNCLRKNFLQRVVGVIKCPNNGGVNKADVDAPSGDLPQSVTNLGNQLSATQNAEKKIAGEISSKRPLEDCSQSSMPRQKKRKTLNSSPRTPKRGKPITSLDVLPQVKIPVSRKCQPIPNHVLALYVEAERILDNAERDIETFFEEDDDDDDENEEKCQSKDSTSVAPSALDEDLVFKEITNFQQRHEYKKFYNRNLRLGQHLQDGIDYSNDYLFTLRQAVKLLPVYPRHNTKLVTKFNKALLSYKVNPVHGQYKTVCRNLVLVKMLIMKFNNKHGLASTWVPTNVKEKIAC